MKMETNSDQDGRRRVPGTYLGSANDKYLDSLSFVRYDQYTIVYAKELKLFNYKSVRSGTVNSMSLSE